jgi:DNA-binding response OmpR family regulator
VTTKTQHTLLLIDEEPQSRRSLQSIVAISGFSVAAVPSARAALDLLRKGFAPCAILVNVPDPPSALSTLRTESAEVASIPILILSGQTSRDDRPRLIGAREVLHLPIDFASLIAAIERHCRRSHPQPSIRILLTPTHG